MDNLDQAKAAFTKIAQQMAVNDPRVKAGKLFGSDCIKANGKAFVSLHDSTMVFKLTGKRHAHALSLSGAKLFEPGNMGRAMKEWVQVPFDHVSEWADLASDALEYVAGLE